MSMLKSVKLSCCQVVKFDPWDMLNNFCEHRIGGQQLLLLHPLNLATSQMKMHFFPASHASHPMNGAHM